LTEFFLLFYQPLFCAAQEFHSHNWPAPSKEEEEEEKEPQIGLLNRSEQHGRNKTLPVEKKRQKWPQNGLKMATKCHQNWPKRTNLVAEIREKIWISFGLIFS